MSLYANYVQERLGKMIIESEMGFATYSFFGESCYIEDIYVRPDCRHDGIAAKMADEIAAIAKGKGFKFLIGTVAPTANGSTEGMKVLLAYGFRLDSSINNLICLKKDL